ncbi:MOSC domain-containing protein [Gordonia sp. CPCC 205333]
MIGTVEAVCVVHDERPIVGPFGRTSIDKRPVAGEVTVTEFGLRGDKVSNTRDHGGLAKAVYAYSAAEAERWEKELGRHLSPGWFGENLRIRGIAVSDAVIGERWVFSSGLVLEVTLPRVPCIVFGRWAGESKWVRRFAEQGDIGAYLRVVVPAAIQAGDSVEVLDPPDHQVTIRDFFGRTASAENLASLIADPEIVPEVLAEATKRLKQSRRKPALS